MLSSTDKLYGAVDFITGLGTCPQRSNWYSEYHFTVPDQLAIFPDWNPTDNLLGIVKKQMKDTRLNNIHKLISKQPGAP